MTLALSALGVLRPAVAAAQGQTQAQPRARGQSNFLVGYVVNVIGRPMQGAEVYIANTDRSVRTDARGFWRIEDPPTGARVVVARLIGHVPFMREMEIGSSSNDTVSLLLRKFPTRLSTVQVNAQTRAAAAYATVTAERLSQLHVGNGRLFTRDQILEARPYSVAELINGVVGLQVTRGQGEITVTSKRAGVGVRNVEGQQCQLQFYLDNTPIDNEGVATLNPLDFRSVEVYPQTVLLPGLPMRSEKCGAIVINSIRR